jgi:hypothetical protein
MHFFDRVGWTASSLWIYFTIAAPITCVCLALWIAYTDRKIDFEALKNLLTKGLLIHKRARTSDKKATKHGKRPSSELAQAIKPQPELSASSSSSNRDLEAQAGAERIH